MPPEAIGSHGANDPILFYFDYISPNAYLAWMRIHEVAERQGRGVTPVPVLFAALLAAGGRPGPAEVRDMWRWMVRNILRKAALHGIPLKPPRAHPFNPLLALRVSSLPMPDSVRRRIVDGLFRAVWAGGPGVEDEREVARVAAEAGLDAERTLRDAKSPEGKDRLRRQTEEAIAAGVFGVPAIRVGEELFWGHDDLEFMERFLEGRDPLPRGDLAAWEAVRPSAWRRGAPAKPQE